MSNFDYIDPDVAYLLGLIVARGEFSGLSGVNRIKIEFPFKNLQVRGIEKEIKQRDKILVSLRKVRSRINELTDMNIKEIENKHSIFIIMETMKNTVFWRNLRYLLHGKTNYYEFEIPDVIFKLDTNIKKEFIRGFADVAGSARFSNRDIQGKCRVYLDVLNSNWYLPIQLCHLLQDHLNIPVDTIAWGHPNIRDPNLNEYNEGRRNAWTREHQIKIFAEDFEKIGFYMEHKQEILNELARYNREHGFKESKFCTPPKRIRKKKPEHPEEKSEKLPQELRGKHYNAYWEICVDLGCLRYKLKNKRKIKRKGIRG